jgi:hypothetical protein
MSGRSVLELLGLRPHQARNLALVFRERSIQTLHEMAPHTGDQARLVAAAKAGRQQLEDLFAREREAQVQRHRGRGFHGEDSAGTDPDSRRLRRRRQPLSKGAHTCAPSVIALVSTRRRRAGKHSAAFRPDSNAAAAHTEA